MCVHLNDWFTENLVESLYLPSNKVEIFLFVQSTQKNDWWAGQSRIKSDSIFVWHLIDIMYPRLVFDNNKIYLVPPAGWTFRFTLQVAEAQRSCPLTQNSTGSVRSKLVRDNWEILIVIFLAIPIHCSVSWCNGSMRTAQTKLLLDKYGSVFVEQSL